MVDGSALGMEEAYGSALQIDGILLTMVDGRTNFAKEISALLRETYGSKIKVFGSDTVSLLNSRLMCYNISGDEHEEIRDNP